MSLSWHNGLILSVMLMGHLACGVFKDKDKHKKAPEETTVECITTSEQNAQCQKNQTISAGTEPSPQEQESKTEVKQPDNNQQITEKPKPEPIITEELPQPEPVTPIVEQGIKVDDERFCSYQQNPFGGGRGHAKDPFLICSVGHLESLKKFQGQNIHVRLVQDLNLIETGFSPIPYFSGVFNGDGHVISNFSIKLENGSGPLGFINILVGEVRNLTLTNVAIFTEEHNGSIGGLVGTNLGSIINSHVTGTMSGHIVGGIAGINELGKRILNSSSQVLVQVKQIKAQPSVKIATLWLDVCGQWWCDIDEIMLPAIPIGGGLVGLNRGNIIKSLSSGEVKGSGILGGLTGQSGDDVINALIIESTSSAIVEAISDELAIAGGLVGLLKGTISRSSAYGNVTSLTNTPDFLLAPIYAGGLVGMTDKNAKIELSFARNDFIKANYAGGLVGHHKSGIIEYCYAANTIINMEPRTEQLSELVGDYIGKNAAIINSFVLKNNTIIVFSGKGKLKCQLRQHLDQKHNLIDIDGWDFKNIWQWKELRADEVYPELR